MDKSMIRKAVFSCNAYTAGKTIEEVKRELGLEHVIKMSSNENPYGPSPKVFEAINAEMPNLYMYPERSFIEIKEAIAELNGVDARNIAVGHGSETIIQMIPQLFVNPQDEVIVSGTSYDRHAEASMLMDAKIVRVPAKNHGFDLEAMADAITDKTKLVWLCNPNNPTGTIFRGPELKKFMARIPKHVVIIFDEAYIEFADDPEFVSGLAYFKNGNNNVIILRTFSKAYGMAGIRLAYGIMDTEVKQAIDIIKEPFNLGRIPIVTGLAAIKDQEWLQSCVEKTLKEKYFLYNELAALGLEVIPTNANFIMIDVKQDGKELFNRLARKGIIARPGNAWGYQNHIRVTLGTHEDNLAFLKALKEVL